MAALGDDKIYATRTGVAITAGRISNYLEVDDIFTYAYATTDFQTAVNTAISNLGIEDDVSAASISINGSNLEIGVTEDGNTVNGTLALSGLATGLLPSLNGNVVPASHTHLSANITDLSATNVPATAGAGGTVTVGLTNVQTQLDALNTAVTTASDDQTASEVTATAGGVGTVTDGLTTVQSQLDALNTSTSASSDDQTATEVTATAGGAGTTTDGLTNVQTQLDALNTFTSTLDNDPSTFAITDISALTDGTLDRLDHDNGQGTTFSFTEPALAEMVGAVNGLQDGLVSTRSLSILTGATVGFATATKPDNMVYLGVSAGESAAASAGGAGSRGVYIGRQNGQFDAGIRNTSVGYRALRNNTSGGNLSVAVGYLAASDVTGLTLGRSVFVGSEAGSATTGQTGMVFIGSEAGLNSAGDNVVLVGRQSGENNTQDNLTASGFQSAQNNTGSTLTAYGNLSAKNNTGFASVIIGSSSGLDNTGDNCILIGESAGIGNTGSQTTVMGRNSGTGNTKDNVTLIGHNAGYNSNGPDNTSVGTSSLLHGGSPLGQNTAIGSLAFSNFSFDTPNATTLDNTTNSFTLTAHGITVGERTTIQITGTTEPTGFVFPFIILVEATDANTLLTIDDDFTDNGVGLQAALNNQSITNSTAIGYDAQPDASNMVQLGDTNVTLVRTSGDLEANGVTTVSDETLKRNFNSVDNALNIINALKLFEFEYIEEANVNGQKIHYGLKAQDVLKIANKFNLESLKGAVRERTDGTLSLNYSIISMLSVQAVQEISKKQDEIEKRLEKLEKLAK